VVVSGQGTDKKQQLWLSGFGTISLVHGATFGAFMSRIDLLDTTESLFSVGLMLLGTTGLLFFASSYSLLRKFRPRGGSRTIALAVLLFAAVIFGIASDAIGLEKNEIYVKSLIVTVFSWVLWSHLLANILGDLFLVEVNKDEGVD
jgi:hypothetical protein